MRWALLGASDIAATKVIPALAAAGQSIDVVLSASLERAQTYAAGHAIRAATDDLQAAVSCGAEAAYVSSFNARHFEQTMAALKSGLHVLCEKPVATTVEQAHEMVEAARQANLVLATNHHLRNNPVHIKARELISNGELGELLGVRIAHGVLLPERLRGWRIADVSAGGVILDIAIHSMDLLRFLTGMEQTTVSAVAVQQGLAVGPPDAMMGVGLLDDHVPFSANAAYTIRHASTGMDIYGTKGTLTGHDCMTARPAGTLTIERDGRRDDVPVGAVPDLYTPAIEAFVEATRGRGLPVASGDDGRRSLQVALALQQSVISGSQVKLDLDSGPAAS